ncbi:MAG: hypothetical protein HYY06_09725 [Deltaproteobacteria bacterium]|nr:hypothetical protein [Deltaproteobacteria bacterium]
MIIAAILSGCSPDETPLDPVASHEEELEIDGTRSDSSGTTNGSLNISLLHRDLVSACFAEMERQLPGICNGTSSRGALDTTDCAGHQCMLQVNLCMGHKLMQVADEVAEFELTTQRLNVNKQGAIQRQTGGTVTYTIPPQSAANRTLAYRLAGMAFAAAGERGVTAIGDTVCMADMMATVDETDDVTKNRAEIFAVSYADVVHAYTEATYKLTDNEVRVAGDKGQQVRDYTAGRQALWNDTENSIRAALAAIGMRDDPEGVREPVELNPCARAVGLDSIQDALAIIRAQPIREILYDDLTDLQVIDDIQEAFVQEFAVDGAPRLYPGGETPEAFLARFNVTVDDFAQAREYAKDEHRVFQRTELETAEGSGRLAGLASPPTPLPAAVTLASTAGAVRLASTNIDDPSYRAAGALQTLDYLRWGARKALRQSETAPSFLEPRLRPILAAAAAVAETEVGHLRIQVVDSGAYPEPPPSDIPIDGYPSPGGVTVLVHGVQRCDDGQCEEPGIGIKLVRSVDGLRCVLHGNIEGAPCDPDDYILATEPDFFDAQDQYDQQLDGTFGFDIPPISEPIFVVKHASPDELIGGFYAPGMGEGRARILSMGGKLQDVMDYLAQPSPAGCGEPQRSCAGLPRDLVVPLESEITEDNDPYENSWKHYLDLADQMATEADSLGEELIRAGLEMDMRGEAARDELESICGGVVNVAKVFDSAEGGSGDLEDLLADAAQEADPSLATCLPDPTGADLEPWVTLGDEDLCAWQYGNGAPCVCPSDLADLDGCQARCPWPKQETCELPDDLARYESPNGQHFTLIPGPIRRLGLLPAPAVSAGEVRCWPLGALRDPEYAYQGGNTREDMIEQLTSQDWFRPNFLQQLVSASSYDEDWRDGLELSVSGIPVFSTAEGPNVPPCDEPVGDATWTTAPSLFIWNACGSPGALRPWIRDMRRAFGTLGALAGALDGNLTRSWKNNAEGVRCDDVLGVDGERQCYRWDEDDRGDDEEEDREEDAEESCDKLEGACRCVTAAGPGGAGYGNVVCPDVRFDSTLHVRRALNPNAALNRLWGITDPIEGDATIRDILDQPVEAAPRRFDADFPWDSILAVALNVDVPWPRDRGIFYDQLSDGEVAGRSRLEFDLESITDEDIYDALALGCYLALTQGGGCEQFDPTFVPEIRAPDDLRQLEQQLQCAADAILTSTGRGLLANVPKVVADSVGSGQPLSPYPGYRGELLDALVALQGDIESVASTTNAIQAQVRRAASAVSLTRQRLEITDLQAQIAQLQTISGIIATVSNALAASIQSFGMASGAASAAAAAEVVILDEISQIEGQLSDLEKGTIVAELAEQAGDIMAELSRLGSELRTTVYRLNADLGRIESLRSAALSAAARAAFMDRDETGRLFPVTTVMRRRYNTLRTRYERARDRARQMAFIARRAIEQRFGLELGDLDRDLTLVESPSTWASDVCDFEGIDYARIRQAQVDEEVPEDERIPENYVDGYLGEYVDKLRLFVESYPFDFPFQDGNDLAVISLRDDIYRARQECEVVVPNLIASSERVAGNAEAGADGGPWFVHGCPDEDGDGQTAACLHLGSQAGLVEDGRMANRIADAPIELGSYGGRVYQDVVIENAPTELLLSWVDRFVSAGELEGAGAEDLLVAAPVDYRVSIEMLDGAGDLPLPADLRPDADGVATPRQLETFLVTEPGTVRIGFEPSAIPGERGDVWISLLQLESLEPGEDPVPSDYMPTVRSGVSIQAVCPDLAGDSLRATYFQDLEEHICPAGMGRDCGPDSENVIRTLTFHEATFGLGLEQIERGEIIPSAQIALGNYNYRHDLVAVNLVGTNVRDCSESDEPATCYSNAFVPVTLIHEGEDIPIRNHDGDTVPFDFERAFIEHGKALASEVVLTNPLSSSMETLLGPYYKQELRGRPLMGHYTLRIWDDPALNWENVEDVQLVFRYRYWTRFER